MTTSDGGSARAGLPTAPELHGTDLGAFVDGPSAKQPPTAFPSLEQISGWANEFFRTAGSADAVERGVPTYSGLPSGFPAPPPNALGRRAASETPNMPFVQSTPNLPLPAADPNFGSLLDHRPDVIQPSIVGSPTLGGIDPIGRGAGIPQPQSRGREALATLDPSASPAVPYYLLERADVTQSVPYFMERGEAVPAAGQLDIPSLDAGQPDAWRVPSLGSPAVGSAGTAGRGMPSGGAPGLSSGVPSGGAPATSRDLHTRGAPAKSRDLDARGAPAAHGGRQANAARGGARGLNVESVRADFPILTERVNGKPLVWLDNAATTQKPNAVIERLSYFYRHENSNIHRGAHTLAARSTDAYEAARETVRRFLNAGSAEEIVFVRGATEGINLVANSWGGRFVEAGDEVIVSRIEHHSNIVPWQMLCARVGARLRVAEVDDTGQIRLDQYERLFNKHTRLVAVTHVSNALGTIVPVQAMIQIAHRHGARVLIDGAQSVCHMPVDVQALDADFLVFSGHKIFGPTGIGVVYGKESLLAAMPPWQGGGNMIGDVTFDKTQYQPPPARFEAGTGNIADAVGLATALEYLESLGLENVARYEHELLEYGTAKLLEIPGLHLIGTAKEKAAVLGFVLENMPAEQVGSALASEGIAVRSGHHCAQPALRRFGHEATVRPSLAVYNNHADIDALVAVLRDLQSRWLR
jgi:cysteine desulfurase/selenocysteine lyase